MLNLIKSQTPKSKYDSHSVVGIQRGDEGKGKVVDNLIQKFRSHETVCFRWCGGSNAGHTIRRGNQVFKTHIIPSGIIEPGVNCCIGSYCYVNLEKIKKEISDLESAGVQNIKERLFISALATVVEQKHIDQDIATNVVGTTGQGIGPAASDHHLRTAKKVRDFRSEFERICNVIEDTEEMFKDLSDGSQVVFEGAQSLELSLNSRNYPFVTSSITDISTIFTTGVSYKCNFTTYFVSKMYETYVGTMDFQPPGEVFERIAKEGHEFGTTTGRGRKVNYLDITNFRGHIRRNTIDDSCLIFNKGDILDLVHKKYGLKTFVFKDGDKVHEFETLKDMEEGLRKALSDCIQNIYFSNTADSNEVIF